MCPGWTTNARWQGPVPISALQCTARGWVPPQGPMPCSEGRRPQHRWCAEVWHRGPQEAGLLQSEETVEALGSSQPWIIMGSAGMGPVSHHYAHLCFPTLKPALSPSPPAAHFPWPGCSCYLRASMDTCVHILLPSIPSDRLTPGQGIFCKGRRWIWSDRDSPNQPRTVPEDQFLGECVLPSPQGSRAK